MDNLKDNIMKFAKKVVKTKIVILIVIVVIINVLLSSFLEYITLSDGIYKEGDMSSTPYAVSKQIKSIRFTGEGIKYIYVDEATGAEEEKSSEEMAKMTWDDMIKAGSKVQDYLKSEQELETLINAEIITQYPKIYKSDIKLNGIVEFHRYKSDGTVVRLEYIDNDQFNNYIDNNDIDVMKYFTLDESGNLVIGEVDETTEILTSNDSEFKLSDYTDTLTEDNLIEEGVYSKTQYKISKMNINYKMLIKKYTMPFQYLWSLIVIGEDVGIGLDLTDLIKESEISVGIYENLDTTVNSSTYTYNKERKVDVYAEADIVYTDRTYTSESYDRTDDSRTPDPDWEPAYEVTESTNYEVNHTMTYKNSKPLVDVVKANVWVVDYQKEYEYLEPEVVSQEKNEVELDDTDYEVIDKASSKSDGSDLLYYNNEAGEGFKSLLDKLVDDLDKEHGGEPLDISHGTLDGTTGASTKEPTDTTLTPTTPTTPTTSKGPSASISLCEAIYYVHNVNIKQVDVSTIYSQKYIVKNVINNPKINRKTEEEIRAGTGQDNFVTILCDVSHAEARKMITDEISGWLFDLLKENPDTVDMVDLTKYLLYAVTGNNYGVLEYDFSIYESNGFSTISSGLYNGTTQEKVWFALKDLGYEDVVIAGAMGNIDFESAGFSTVAVEKDGDGIGLCQWSFGRRVKLEAYAVSKELTWQDEDTQIEFLVAEISGQGPAATAADHRLSGYITEEKIISTYSDWVNSSTVEESTLHFMRYFESPRKRQTYDERGTWGKSRLDRAKEYLSEFAGRIAPSSIYTELAGENKDKMQSMITEAVRIANDDRYQYSQTYRESTYYYDCSSFVSRLYKQYFGLTRLDSGTLSRGTDNIKKNCKSNYMEVSLTDLQSGDILWRDGHVALYIGDNQIAEAKSTDAGIVVGTCNIGRFTEAYRVIY